MNVCHTESNNKAERGAGGPESGSQRRAAWDWLGTALGAGSLYCLAPRLAWAPPLGPELAVLGNQCWASPGSVEGTANHKG